MHCPNCGTELPPDSVFCGNCGADVRSYTGQTGTAPAAYAPPTQPGYPPAQPPAQPGYPPQQPYGQPGYPQQQPPKKSSAGLVIGIVVAIVLLLGICGGAFVFRGALAGLLGGGQPAAVATSTPAPAPVDTSTAAPGAEVTGTDGPDGTGGEEIVTKSEAYAVVSSFMDARIAGRTKESLTYCTPSFLASDDGEFVKDKYWHPDSYEITKLTPDLMYIHVTVMGDWPSGREPTIFSVFKDANSGKVLIDGMLDPEQFPELVTE